MKRALVRRSLAGLLVAASAQLAGASCTGSEESPQASAGEASRATAAESLTASHGLLDRYVRDYVDVDPAFTRRALYQAEFKNTFALTPAEMAVLEERGFVVVESPAVRLDGARKGAGPADMYYRLFASELPVFVTGDSILHAWHRSFDSLLEHLEAEVLVPVLDEVLAGFVRELGSTLPADADAMTYFAVAAALLSGEEPPQLPLHVAGPVSEILVAIDAQELATINLVGREREMDFTLFIPRGRYARDPRLRRYFRAMSWLGQAEFAVGDEEAGRRPSDREMAAARAIAATVGSSSKRPLFEAIESFLRALIGEPITLDPATLLRLCRFSPEGSCRASAAELQVALAMLPQPRYSSRVGPGSEHALRLFPQRFAYDAWVTTMTTAPRLGPFSRRTMASPLDVAFALGADRAAHYLVEDSGRPGDELFPAALVAARQEMHAHRPTALAPSVYNEWLESLMALAETELDDRFPHVMRTGAWQDRKMEAVLGSWTELRHDTLLYVAQSIGRLGCQFPRGYVEPVPEMYRHLAAAARHLAPFFAPTAFEGHARNVDASVLPYLNGFGETMARLSEIAEHQLDGRAPSEDELQFIQETVDLHREGYGGQRSYDGWYPRLYWTRGWDIAPNPHEPFSPEGALSKPVVSDVHTDEETSEVLEVGVAHPELMVVAIENSDGEVALHGGPVYDFRSFERLLRERLTDNAWKAMVNEGRLPPRPVFARNYRAVEPAQDTRD